MSVIVELSVPSDRFELGQILSVEEPTTVALETMVPLGDRCAPFVRLSDGTHGSFEQSIRAHPAVDRLEKIDTYDDQVLYALDWTASEDTFFAGVLSTNVRLLAGRGTAETWTFEFRFRSHDALSRFQEYALDAGIPLDIDRVYNPTTPETSPDYGLTGPQRETLSRAVETGYYAIPRQSSTAQLASEFDISDQAVTERLRRAITALVERTLHAEPET